MIFYASQRANAAELAKHLLNTTENDHVTVHEARGFATHDLTEALLEIAAISRGTRCKQYPLTKKTAGFWERTLRPLNMDGRLGCRSVVLWETGCGKCAALCRASARHGLYSAS